MTACDCCGGRMPHRAHRQRLEVYVGGRASVDMHLCGRCVSVVRAGVLRALERAQARVIA